MADKNFLIVVGGPTASGKTDFAIRLARYFHTEILSCDSRQFYREMNIGTAKPAQRELEAVTHHFIDSLSIFQAYSVGDFERDALERLDRLYKNRNIVILTGGSGLYIKALCEGLDKFPEVPPDIRREVEELYAENGLEALKKELQKSDPDYYALVDLNNPHRVMRALAVCRAGGRPFSTFHTHKKVARAFTPIYLQLHWDRAVLYHRIDRRVDQMLKAGLLAETRQLFPHRRLQALQTVGYQELFDHLAGKIDLEEAVKLIKRNSRRYAKRQLTWWRRDGFWKHLRPTDWKLGLRYIDLAMSHHIQFGKTSSSTEESEDRSLLCLGTDSSPAMAGTIDITKTKKAILLSGLSVSPGFPDPGVEELLLHEAILRAEGLPVFYLETGKFPGLPAQCGLKEIPPKEAPKKIRERIGQLQNKDHTSKLFWKSASNTL